MSSQLHISVSLCIMCAQPQRGIFLSLWHSWWRRKITSCNSRLVISKHCRFYPLWVLRQPTDSQECVQPQSAVQVIVEWECGSSWGGGAMWRGVGQFIGQTVRPLTYGSEVKLLAEMEWLSSLNKWTAVWRFKDLYRLSTIIEADNALRNFNNIWY